MQFYLAIGFTINPLFTDAQQKCLVWSDSICIMLQTRDFANTYIEKEVVAPATYQMPSFTLPLESINHVDEIMNKALTAGGKEPASLIHETFMYLRSFQDLDGYLWGIMYLDTDKFKSLKSSVIK